MRVVAGFGLLMLSAAASAQVPADDRPTIQVAGRGTVSTPPDVATLDYWVKGEGQTADEASAALARKNKAIVGGLAALLGQGTQASSGNVIVIQAHGKECDDNRGYGSQPRLSTGACAVTGYLATLQGQVRTAAVDKAGTAAGLAARLGASDARLQSFDLSDKSAAQRRATAAALKDARAKAETIAAGSAVRLGPLLSVTDQNGMYGAEIVRVSGASIASAPPAPVAPIAIDVRPRPVETVAQLVVRYAILP